MKQLITNNKALMVINIIYLILITMQETQYIDLFPFSDVWNKAIKGTVALVIAVINVLGLKSPKND